MGLLKRAPRSVELCRNLQMRSRKPHPLTPDIVHVREDRRNRPNIARRFGFPHSRVKMFQKNLVHPIIDGKHLKLQLRRVESDSVHGLWLRSLLNKTFWSCRQELISQQRSQLKTKRHVLLTNHNHSVMVLPVKPANANHVFRLSPIRPAGPSSRN